MKKIMGKIMIRSKQRKINITTIRQTAIIIRMITPVMMPVRGLKLGCAFRMSQ